MKTIFACFLLLTLSPALRAQQTIDARDIIAKINRHEPVSYQNATITGTLDLTELANKQATHEGRDNESFLSTVEVPLTFIKCIFKGDVLAYKTIPEGNNRWGNSTVYNANFDEAVRFESCEFLGKSTFKYSRFRAVATFTGNRFQEEALFKYSKFADNADFTGSTFGNYANFKYTDFKEGSGFRQTTFGNYADFKYTEFHEGVDFSDARFGKVADFKYVKFPRGTNFSATHFGGMTDFKYATLEGRKFSPER